MAEQIAPSKKSKQISLEEYAKIKEKLAKSKLKLNLPLIIKLVFVIPAIYWLFLVIYYLVYLRFVAQH